MPTGYTADIAKDISFDEFIMGCARGMGACVTMRDDSSDTPIPDSFEPSDYHSKKLLEIEDTREWLESLSSDAIEIEALLEYGKEKKADDRYLEEKKELKKKYEAMLVKANEWIPPTSDHKGLKDFMIEQITGSIDFDCSEEFHTSPIKLSGAEWFEKRSEKIERDYQYHLKADIEEVSRTADRTDWVQKLRDSIA